MKKITWILVVSMVSISAWADAKSSVAKIEEGKTALLHTKIKDPDFQVQDSQCVNKESHAVPMSRCLGMIDNFEIVSVNEIFDSEAQIKRADGKVLTASVHDLSPWTDECRNLKRGEHAILEMGDKPVVTVKNVYANCFFEIQYDTGELQLVGRPMLVGKRGGNGSTTDTASAPTAPANDNDSVAKASESSTHTTRVPSSNSGNNTTGN